MKTLISLFLSIYAGARQSFLSNPSASYVVLFIFFNMGFVSAPVIFRQFILALSLAVLLWILFYRDDWQWAKKIYHDWLHFSRGNSEEIAHSLAAFALIIFFLSVILHNLGLNSIASWLLLGVITSGVMSGLLLAVALWYNHPSSKIVIPAIGLLVSFLYNLTSSYIASEYLVIVGLKLNESPILNFWISTLSCAVWICVITYPATGLILLIDKKRKSQRIQVTLVAVSFSLLFGSLLYIQSYDALLVKIQDYAIKREWQTSYWCAGSEQPEYPQRKGYTERYFIIDDTNWIVYFNDSDKQWGFRKLHCVTGTEGEAFSTWRTLQKAKKMPNWHDSGN